MLHRREKEEIPLRKDLLQSKRQKMTEMKAQQEALQRQCKDIEDSIKLTEERIKHLNDNEEVMGQKIMGLELCEEMW